MIGDALPDDKPGGSGTYLWEVSRRLVSSGHQVFILVQKHHPERPLHQKKDGVHIYRFGGYQGNLLFSLFARFRSSRKIFKKLAREVQFDLININFPLGAYSIIRSVKNQSIPCLYIFHGAWSEESLTENKKILENQKGLTKLLSIVKTKLAFWIMSHIEQSIFQRIDRFLVVSRFNKNILAEKYDIPSKKIVMIPGGVDTARFYPNQDKYAARKALDLPAHLPILLSIRRLVARMGLENLILAMRIVLSKHQAILVIGGSGQLKDHLLDLINKNGLEKYIRIVGHIPEGKLPLYYQAADLFVVPSLIHEGFGLVTLEALSSGVPVVGTAVGGTTEILGKLDPHLLVSENNPHSLAESIITTLDRSNHDAAHIRQFAEDNYCWNNIFPLVEECFTTTADLTH